MATRSPSADRPHGLRRVVSLLGLLALLVSLLAPILSMQDAAGQTITSQQEACDPGFERNPATGECEREPAEGPEEPLPECDEGTSRDPDSGECVRDEVPPECADGLILDPTTGQCVAQEESSPPDVAAEPTSAPALGEPPLPLPSNVALTRWECPPGTDPLSDRTALLELCWSPSGEPTSITHGWQDGEESTQSVSGYASWNDVPPGVHYLYEMVPATHLEPSVWCGTYIEGESTPLLNQMAISNGNTVSHELHNGESLYCDWFSILAGTPTGFVQVYKLACPSDFVPDATTTIDDLQNACTEPVQGITFHVLDGGTELSSAPTDGTGLAQLGEVPATDIVLVEDTPGGYGEPLVYCFADYAFQPLEHTFTEADRQPVGPGNGIAWSLQADTLLQCFWYTTKLDSEGLDDLTTESETAQADEASGNLITMVKYRCPLGVPVAEVEAELVEMCVAQQENVEFTLTYENVSDTRSTDADGKVSWDDIPAGLVSVQETIPPGFGDPMVFCHNDPLPLEPFPIGNWLFSGPAHDGVLHWNLGEPPGYLTCQWYNIRTDDSQVVVHKRLCDPGANLLGINGVVVFDHYAEHCTDEGDGFVFTIDHTGGVESLPTEAGTVAFPAVPPGPFTLAEAEIPDGFAAFGLPDWFCSFAPDGAPLPPPQPIDAPGGVLSDTLATTGTYVCWVFNRQAQEGSTITIRKWDCPPGYVIDPMVADPLTDCVDATNGVTFHIDDGNAPDPDQTRVTGDDGPGTVIFAGLEAGTHTVTEEVPAGIAQATGWCASIGQIQALDNPPRLVFDLPDGVNWECDWLNVPADDRKVTVWKWYCPEGLEPESEDFQDWKDTCVNHPQGIDFTVTDANGAITKHLAGSATWHGTATGDVSITEHTPPSFHDPIVFCTLDAMEVMGGVGLPVADGPTMMPVTDSTVSRTLDYPEYDWICHFFNTPVGPAEIIVKKWTCPANLPGGYDPVAWGADPTVDCTEMTDGVLFTLTPEGNPPVMQHTGDLAPGLVSWDMLDPGNYVVTETLPPGIDHAFVWDCTGTNIPAVHPMPLSWGTELQVTVAPGDVVVCNWYNVYPPEDGWLTVYKHTCWTAVFTSELDCEIFEFAAEFELFKTGQQPSLGAKVTDGAGTATWWPLDAGPHTLLELGATPCHVTMSKTDGNGNAWVDLGEETVVHVYNCSDDSSTPGGKIPVKYPNTGANPLAADSGAALQATPPGSSLDEPAYFEIRCLDAGTTPVTGTEACPRGAAPERIVIEAAQVDHAFEIVEVIDGVMEAPSGPDIVSWYKETGRLGEPNNMVVAGHLNSWNVPEGVFFHLETLDEGDRIEIIGDNGSTHVFEVEWVRLEDNNAPPDPELIGPTDEPTLTLITCGGEWNAAISEYDKRTVVRAVQVEVISPDPGTATTASPDTA